MKRYILLNLIFLLSIMLGSHTFAQERYGRINGVLRHADTGEPLMYGNVTIKGTGIGAASDINGYYTISNLPAGNFTMLVTIIGHERIEREISVVAGLEQRQDFEMLPADIVGQEVVVTGERQRFERQVEVSAVSLSMRDVKVMPAFVEADIFRTLQLLPGVQSSSDFSLEIIKIV
jgi:hypothetical protein